MNIYQRMLFAADGVGGGASGGAAGVVGGAPASTSSAASTSNSGGSPSTITPSEVIGGGTRDDGGGSSDGDIDMAGFTELDTSAHEIDPLESGAKKPVASSTPVKDGAGAEGLPATKPPAPAEASPAPVAKPGEATTELSSVTDADDVTLDNVSELFEKEEAVIVDHWAKTFFQFSPEDVEKLATVPEQVLPQLAAKILFRALASVPQQIKRFVPGLIDARVAGNQRNASAESEFFASWGGLKSVDPEHVISAIESAKRVLPKGFTRAQAIEKAGQIACAMLGMDVAAARGGAKAPPVAGPTGGGRPGVVVSEPFHPAGAGSGRSNGSAAPGAVDPNDPWAEFGLPNT